MHPQVSAALQTRRVVECRRASASELRQGVRFASLLVPPQGYTFDAANRLSGRAKQTAVSIGFSLVWSTFYHGSQVRWSLRTGQRSLRASV